MSKLNEVIKYMVELILECLEKVLSINGEEKNDLEVFRKFSKKWIELNNTADAYIENKKDVIKQSCKISYLRNLNIYFILLLDSNQGRITEFYRYLDLIFKKVTKRKNLGEYEALIIKIAIVIAVCENDMSVLYSENIVNILESLGVFETTKESRKFMDELLPMLRQELPALAKKFEIYLLRAGEEYC